MEALYDSRKSFYGKAVIRKDSNKKILTSYTTDVAYIEDGKLYVNGWYSATTARHINEFALQNGFKRMTKKEMERFSINKLDKLV